jgi:hypothetical protein
MHRNHPGSFGVWVVVIGSTKIGPPCGLLPFQILARNTVASAHPDPMEATRVSVGEKVLPEGRGTERPTP